MRNACAHAAMHTGHRPILLFDGTCAFCDRTVRLCLRLDRRGRLLFAPLQSPAGAFLAERFAVPDDVDSVVLIEPGPGGGRARVRSAAALGIARSLGFPWSLAMVFWVVPAPVRDWAYRLLARHRYRLFGRVESCTLPEEGWGDRVIESAERAAAVVEGDEATGG